MCYHSPLLGEPRDGAREIGVGRTLVLDVRGVGVLQEQRLVVLPLRRHPALALLRRHLQRGVT